MYTNSQKEHLKLIELQDISSFDLFYDVYYDQVFRYAYYFLKDVEACKDVVSEVFLSVWKSREKLGEIDNIDAWLYVITKNQVMRYQCNLDKRQETYCSPVLVEMEKTTESTPEEKMLDSEIEALLNHAINALPEKCRIIFLMIRYEGRTTAEVAEILSIKESTVRVQIKIATEKIMNRVKKEYPHLSLPVFLSFIFML